MKALRRAIAGGLAAAVAVFIMATAAPSATQADPPPAAPAIEHDEWEWT